MSELFKKRWLPLLLLLALLLTACGTGKPAAPLSTADSAEAPESTPEAEEIPEELPEGAVAVSTVDELLAAIAPNTTIVLQEGEYDLSTAADYGREDLRGYYRWDLVLGGAKLSISDLGGLRLVGQGEVSILAQPRYAEVLELRGCWDIALEGLTLGHAQEPGGCAAGVLYLAECENVTLDRCRLFGCGVLGVQASNCESVTLRETRIDGCSSGAVYAWSCRDLRLEDCQLCDNGLGKESPGDDLIYTERCKGFALVNCEITGNRVNRILQNNLSDQAVLLGCRVEENRILSSVFLFQGRSVTVDKCSFRLRSSERYYPYNSSIFAQDPKGEELISFDLDHMELARAEYEGPVYAQPARPEPTELPDGSMEVHVSTVDELLAAIAPNTIIYLEPGEYDLSAASDYGVTGGDWYVWEDCFDGYCLTIQGVQGLHILGAGQRETLISALPRYAAVLRFRACEDLSLSGLTAGHSQAPGYCAGNVLDFDSCRNVTVADCGLFGCGVMGVWAWACEGITLRESEIYECSYAGAEISSCWEVSFEGCSIHDCDEERNYIFVTDGEIAWNESSLASGVHAFDGEDYLGVVEPGW